MVRDPLPPAGGVPGPDRRHVAALGVILLGVWLGAGAWLSAQHAIDAHDMHFLFELVGAVLALVGGLALFGRYTTLGTRLTLLSGAGLFASGVAGFLVALREVPASNDVAVLWPIHLGYALWLTGALAAKRISPRGMRPQNEAGLVTLIGAALGLAYALNVPLVTEATYLGARWGEAAAGLALLVLAVVWARDYQRQPTLLGMGMAFSIMGAVLGQGLWLTSRMVVDWPALWAQATWVGVFGLPIGVLLYETPVLIQERTATAQWLESLQEASREMFLGTQQAYFDVKRLHEIGQVLAQTMDLDVIPELVVAHAQGVVEASACYLWLLGVGESFTRIVTPGPEGARLQARYTRLEQLPALARAVRTRRTLTLTDVRTLPPEEREGLWNDLAMRAGLLVPLVWREQVIGVLVLVDERGPREFTPNQIDTVQSLASQAAVALQNAQLYTAAQTERRTLKAVLDGAGDVVLVCDPQGALLLFNPAAAEAFGLAAEQIGAPLNVAVPALPLQVQMAFDGALRPELWEQVLADRRTLLARLSPVSEVGVVIVMHDITHLKEFDRLRSELFTTVVHDLKNPLHITLGALEMLIDDFSPLQGDQEFFAASARRGLVRMQALISDLLNLEKIRAGVGDARVPCALDAIVGEALEDLAGWAADKGVRVAPDMQAGLATVQGNRSQLAQVVHNLVGNAIKYTPQGGQVRVLAESDGHMVRLAVIDNGHGIASDDLPHVFDRFYRAQHNPAEGTGLGLTIVKTIVEKHGGRVWAESEIGRGSTFYVVLPLDGEVAHE